MTEGSEIKRELVRKLFGTAEIWENLRELHRQQTDSLEFLKSYKGNESWFRVTTTSIIGDENHDSENNERFLELQGGLKRLETIGLGISENLVKETTALIAKVNFLHSIPLKSQRLTSSIFLERLMTLFLSMKHTGHDNKTKA